MAFQYSGDYLLAGSTTITKSLNEYALANFTNSSLSCEVMSCDVKMGDLQRKS